MRRASLRPLFDAFNAQFWAGRLPVYRVHRRRLPGGVNGCCDRTRRIITIDRRLDDDRARTVLLHEMCHIRTANHGTRFLAELTRLVAHGEAWAAEERATYADPTRAIKVTWRAAKEYLENIVLAVPDVPWPRAKAAVAGWFAVSVRDLNWRFPRAKATFRRLQEEERRDRARVARLEEKWRQSTFSTGTISAPAGSASRGRPVRP
jgi:hypothetical protein